MDEVPRKVKHSRVRSTLIGSKIEDLIRWALKRHLDERQEFETIVGFTNWSILPRFEVDIPFVLIRRSDQKLFKFALEVDGERFHEDPAGWENKKRLLLKAGWYPLNARITDDMSKRYAWQIYQKGNVMCLPVMAQIFTEIDVVFNSQQLSPRDSRKAADGLTETRDS